MSLFLLHLVSYISVTCFRIAPRHHLKNVIDHLPVLNIPHPLWLLILPNFSVVWRKTWSLLQVIPKRQHTQLASREPITIHTDSAYRGKSASGKALRISFQSIVTGYNKLEPIGVRRKKKQKFQSAVKCTRASCKVKPITTDIDNQSDFRFSSSTHSNLSVFSLWLAQVSEKAQKIYLPGVRNRKICKGNLNYLQIEKNCREVFRTQNSTWLHWKIKFLCDKKNVMLKVKDLANKRKTMT